MGDVGEHGAAGILHLEGQVLARDGGDRVQLAVADLGRAGPGGQGRGQLQVLADLLDVVAELERRPIEAVHLVAGIAGVDRAAVAVEHPAAERDQAHQRRGEDDGAEDQVAALHRRRLTFPDATPARAVSTTVVAPAVAVRHGRPWQFARVARPGRTPDRQSFEFKPRRGRHGPCSASRHRAPGRVM
jgi:hypothetical protein